jgi:hypothetical protein
MLLSKSTFATLFLWLAVIAVTLPTGARAFEGDEQPCPAFANLTDFPSCEDCVSNGCGHVVDDKDCVSNCTDVPDAPCFSMATNSGMSAADICAEASAPSGAPTSSATSEGVTSLFALFLAGVTAFI